MIKRKTTYDLMDDDTLLATYLRVIDNELSENAILRAVANQMRDFIDKYPSENV